MTADNTSNEKSELTEALSGIAQLYEKSLSDHGLSSKSVGWKDEDSQLLRFDKLVSVIASRHAAEEISVSDFGCGYGAMFNYLDDLAGVRLGKYYGYDISEEMLTAAKRSVADPRAEFIQSSEVKTEADYSFVSGTFNVKLEASDEAWAEHVKKVLVNLASTSRKGFAFNLLSTYVDWKQDHLFYADPFLFFDFCKRNISPYVSLLHDYPLYEWTIIVRKKDSPE
ncbi:MAG TPA: class I SAM-dependent methyltransferase [Pyrinomonadaceae bacterium]|jgi:SAM-dependent methyltransferase|nr:class I SAM-dependent methyltransferase [Pyrinomonadaceae bacterium]